MSNYLFNEDAGTTLVAIAEVLEGGGTTGGVVADLQTDGAGQLWNSNNWSTVAAYKTGSNSSSITVPAGVYSQSYYASPAISIDGTNAGYSVRFLNGESQVSFSKDGGSAAGGIINLAAPLDFSVVDTTLYLHKTGSDITLEIIQSGSLVEAVVYTDATPLTREGSGLYIIADAGSPLISSWDDYTPPDVLAPTLTSATGAADGATTANGSVSTDEANGTLFYILTGNATELVGTVKAASSQSVTDTGVQNVSATGLTPESDYYYHFVHSDSSDNDSSVVSTAQFSTPKLPMLLDSAPSTMAKGETDLEFVISNTATVPTTLNTTISNAGVALVVTGVSGVGPYTITCTAPVDIAKQVGSYAWTAIVDAENVVSGDIDLTPQTGWSSRVLTDPVTTSGSILENATGDAPATGDTVEWQTTTGLSIGPDGEWIWVIVPTVTQVVPRRVIQADGTVGSTANATFTVIPGPTLSSPTDVETGNDTGTGSVSTDGTDGTLYYTVTANASASTTALLAGASQAVTGAGVQNVSYSGLAGSTTYYGHFLHVGADTGVSTVVSGDGFLTDADPLAAPVLSSAVDTKTDNDTGTGSVSTTIGDGTLYFVVTENATEDRATLIAGSSQAVAGTGVQDVAYSGLTGSTTYYGHFFHIAANTDESNIISGDGFLTDDDPVGEVAPVLSSPVGTKVGSSNATGSVTTDKGDGVLQYLVSTNATELVAAVKAGSDQAVSVAGVQSVSVSGLQASTVYYLHYVHTDAGNRDSNVASSSSFTTDVGITPLVVTAVTPVRLASTFTITTDGSYDLTDAVSLHCTIAGIVITNPLSITATQVSFVCPSVGLSLEDLSDVILLLEP